MSAQASKLWLVPTGRSKHSQTSSYRHACAVVLLQFLLVAGGLLTLCLLTVEAQAACIEGPGPDVDAYCVGNQACPDKWAHCPHRYYCEEGNEFLAQTGACERKQIFYVPLHPPPNARTHAHTCELIATYMV